MFSVCIVFSLIKHQNEYYVVRNIYSMDILSNNIISHDIIFCYILKSAFHSLAKFSYPVHSLNRMETYHGLPKTHDPVLGPFTVITPVPSDG